METPFIPSTNLRTSLLKAVVISLFLAGVTFVVFWPARTFGYINYDDDVYVYENPPVEQGLNRHTIDWAFHDTHVGFWIPLTWLSLMADTEYMGSGPRNHHVVNIIFHTCNVVLLFLLLRCATGDTWRCAVVSALFAWHPTRVESVAWVTERKDVLCTFFWLLTMGFYLGYARRRDAGQSRWLPFYCLSLICSVLGFMAKPLLVAMPLALLLFDFWPLQRFGSHNHSDYKVAGAKLAKLVAEKIPFFLTTGAGVFLTMRTAESTLASFPLGLRLAQAAFSYVRYLGKLFLPINLAHFYPYLTHISIWQASLSVLALLIVTFGAIRLLFRMPYIFFGWGWFLLVLVPNIGIVQSGLQGIADRFVYVPSIGFFCALVWMVADLLQKWRSGVAFSSSIAAVVLFSCVCLTRSYLPYWKDSITISERTLSVTSENYLVHNNLGSALEAVGRREEAKAHFRAALQFNPDFVPAHNSMGAILAQEKKLDEAIGHFREAVRLRNNNVLAHINLGLALKESGHKDEAAFHFREAIKFDPESFDAYNALANLLLEQDKIEESIQCSSTALKLKPDSEAAHINAAEAYSRKGQFEKALFHWHEVLRLHPDWPELCNNLAWLLATSHDASFRNGAEAVELALRACRLSQPPSADFLATLAAAYAEAGRFDEAIKTSEQAIATAKEAHNIDLAAKLTGRLQLFRDRRPFHE